MRITWVFGFFWTSFVALSLSGLFLARKPLCIDSRVVERIDRVGLDSSESLYRCGLNRDTPFAPVLYRQLRSLQARISDVEEGLNRIRPLTPGLRVVILENRPWAFRLLGSSLYIGDKILQSPGHLERGLIKAWLRERDFAADGDRDLREEVLSDLVLFALTGQQTGPDEAWPYGLQNAEGYCLSPWRLSEHFELCENGRRDDEAIAARLSLRGLLSSAVIHGWQDLSLPQQINFLRQLPLWLGSRVPSEIQAEVHPVDGDALSVAMAARGRFERWIFEKGRRDPSGLAAQFGRYVEGQLKRAGARGIDDVDFDLMVVAPEPQTKDSSFIAQLAEEAQAHPEWRIAIQDRQKIWILPSRQSFVIRGPHLKADRVATFRCGPFDLDWVFGFEGSAQKLLVINSCHPSEVDLKAWIRGGVEGFATSHPHISFVQFHLPSLQLRRPFLDVRQDLSRLMQQRDLNAPLFQVLGWQNLDWSEKTGAYHPRAVVEGIESFRM